ncbi:MAG: type II toxin-antitoxin system prevent-host-death family antitoxin [Rhodospirillales bacterium]|jgi:prevent-host-death family protein|nr:type II toxin-antitoxin system prevent-host-death family antitoxin [Rhodospirillales bacterium]
MFVIGAYEAKTHLPELLRSVEKGETIIITRRGTPIARIVPFETANSAVTAATIDRMKRARQTRTPMTPAEIMELRDEGRKG